MDRILDQEGRTLHTSVINVHKGFDKLSKYTSKEYPIDSYIIPMKIAIQFAELMIKYRDGVEEWE